MPSLGQAAETLITLARSRAADDRERLLQALGTLCEQAGAEQRAPVRALLTDLLTLMLAQADPEQRARFADRLASARWTPAAVALQLAREPLSDEALGALIERAAAEPGLRAALARRPGLTRDLARALAPYASDALRHALQARFDLEPQPPTGRSPDGADEVALVAKLQAAGRLAPGALLRFLREGRVGAFRAGLAVLSGADAPTVDAACAPEGAQALERLCRRAGLDRAVLREVLALARAET